MRIILCSAILFMSVLAGCATPQYNYIPKSTSISEPPVGTVATVRIGDTMLRQGKFREHDALYLPTQHSVGFAYTLYPGYYLKTGDDETSEFFSPAGGEDSGRVVKAALADPWEAVMTKKNTHDVCVISVFHAAVCKEDTLAERKKYPIASIDSFQQTLIYNGRVGSKINIGYREFSNDIARPAFNNNVEYDLGESKMIAYKGAELEVIDANNQAITFKLIHNFNNAL